MSFLNQLKTQANSLQSQKSAQEADVELNTAAVEKAGCSLTTTKPEPAAEA